MSFISFSNLFSSFATGFSGADGHNFVPDSFILEKPRILSCHAFYPKYIPLPVSQKLITPGVVDEAAL